MTVIEYEETFYDELLAEWENPEVRISFDDCWASFVRYRWKRFSE